MTGGNGDLANFSQFRKVFAKNTFEEWLFKQEASCFEETFFYFCSSFLFVQLGFALLLNLKGKW